VISLLPRRLGHAVLVLWGAFTVSFILLYLLPSNPVAIMANNANGGSSTSAQIAALEAEYGFNKPFYLQYLDRLGQVLRGDLGNSIMTGEPVVRSLGQALPSTLELGGAALLLGCLGGLSLALFSAWTRSPALRQALESLPAVGMCLPTFWVGLMLVEVTSFQLRLLPAAGGTGISGLILPAVTMALPLAAAVAQLLQQNLDVVLAQPFIDTATAKGCSRLGVLLRHALRNAALPALTLIGVFVSNYLVAGAVVVEEVFSRPGIGQIAVEAVTNQDFPVVQGVVLLGALVFVLSGLVVDLLYALIDPRVSSLRSVGG
jgi:peptide/nickel transport system permease protein